MPSAHSLRIGHVGRAGKSLSKIFKIALDGSACGEKRVNLGGVNSGVQKRPCGPVQKPSIACLILNHPFGSLKGQFGRTGYRRKVLGRNFCKSHIDFGEAVPVHNNLGLKVANNLHLTRTVHVDRVDHAEH